MADIFLSYTREDTDRALVMVDMLEREGWTVWFDRFTPPASTWEDILISELESARCVVMLWSSHAVDSEWVAREGESGMERTALVPVLIDPSDIPDMFSSIQFANLTSWDDDPAAPECAEFLRAVRDTLLPSCVIRFESLLEPNLDDLRILYDAFLQVGGRFVKASPGNFSPPTCSDEKRKLTRAIASLQIRIEWDPILSSWFETCNEQKIRAERIERRMPWIWLALLDYSGPFFSSASSPRTYTNFLRFASLMFFHEMSKRARSEGHQLDIPSPLTLEQLSFPRWEGAISAIFEDQDDIAAAYVTHIDDLQLSPEEVFYGPKYRTRLTYGLRLTHHQYSDPVWLERYMIPQRELRFALDGSTHCTMYAGNARIRKTTDLKGNKLAPLYQE